MSTLNLQASKPRRRLAWFVWLLAIPLFVVSAIVVGVGVRESQDERQVQMELESLRQAGQPVDNTTMAEWFERRTSSAGTVAWDEILYLAASPVVQELSDDLPIVGHGKLPIELIPGSDWPDAAKVAEYLQQVQPVLKLVHAAAKLPTPVWFPLQFDGYDTFLVGWQNSRCVVRLIALDAEYACYQREAARALQDIQSIEATAKAFDSQTCLVGDLVCKALRSHAHLAIHRSLQADIWDQQQLSELRSLVAEPPQIEQGFHDVMASERAMAFAAIFENPLQFQQIGLKSNLPIWLLPSGKMRVIEFYASLQESVASFAELETLAKRYDAELTQLKSGALTLDGSHLVLQAMAPSLDGYVAAIERQENLRRLTLTAIGIKQFQLAQQRWPTQLSELDQVGLGPADWTLLTHGPIGYEATPEEVFAWGVKQNQSGGVPAQRPNQLDENGDPNTYQLVIVR